MNRDKYHHIARRNTESKPNFIQDNVWAETIYNMRLVINTLLRGLDYSL